MPIQKKQNKGIRRLWNALFFSIAGFKAIWKTEEAFKQEVIIGIFAIPLALWLGTTYTQKAFLIFSYLLVPIVELLNTAIEVVVDRISLEHHELSKKAKDLGSAAVLTSIICAIIVWTLIAVERF